MENPAKIRHKVAVSQAYKDLEMVLAETELLYVSHYGRFLWPHAEAPTVRHVPEVLVQVEQC